MNNRRALTGRQEICTDVLSDTRGSTAFRRASGTCVR